MDDDTSPQIVSAADVKVTDVLAKFGPAGNKWHSVVQLDRGTGRVRVRTESGTEFWAAACTFDRRYSREEAKRFNIRWRVSPAQRPRKAKAP